MLSSSFFIFLIFFYLSAKHLNSRFYEKDAMSKEFNPEDWGFCIGCLIAVFPLLLISGCVPENHPQADENRSLLIPVEWLYENTSYVNEILEEHGIENVRVLGPEEARVWLVNYTGGRNISN